MVGTHVENKCLYQNPEPNLADSLHPQLSVNRCVCLPNKTVAKTVTWFNYHIHPCFCQWACSILGHGSCSGSILLCQILDKRDATFWSCGVQEEWLPCDLKEQVVGKHLHGFFQMALSNKTPEGRTKWPYLRSLSFCNCLLNIGRRQCSWPSTIVQNYLQNLQ